MKLIMQGMRRSGTTIIYDALCQDPKLTTWYEPLAAAKNPTIGGGSGEQQADLFENIRHERDKVANSIGTTEPDMFNHGAPKDATLEFTNVFPAEVSGYLSHLFSQSENFMAKFTRVYCKVQCMKELCPDGIFVHLVRDPRAVTSSYLFGKNQRNKNKFTGPDVYFGRKTEYTAWSSRNFSNIILSQPGYEQYTDPLDFERILLIWKYTFEETRRGGLDAFGSNYVMIRHEDFCNEPIQQLKKIYNIAGREIPDTVLDWASKFVKKPKPPYESCDKRWFHAFKRLELIDSLEKAGYDNK